MYQLTYISTAKLRCAADDINAILSTSRFNNSRDGITGLLVHDGVRFLQALEGNRTQVDATFDRIKSDPRHRATVILSTREVIDRQFGEWAMASHSANSVSGAATVSMPQLVDVLVSDIKDLNARALFSSFARLDRKIA